jgi:serine/threonine-protein kinase
MGVTEPVRFGVYEVDLPRRELRKHGIRIKLQAQPFELLAALLEKPGELVTREELRVRIWGADTFVEFDQSLNRVANKLRDALGDSADNPRFVETVPRRGYRFIAPVAAATPPPSAVPRPIPTVSWRPAPTPGRWYWVLAGVLVAVAVVSLWVASHGSTDIGRRAMWLDLDAGTEVSQPAISPDGNTLVFVARSRLVVRQLNQAKITPLAGTEGASSPFFSPDGQWVGYFANHQLRKVALAGGESTILCDAPRDRGATWMEDGQIIAALSATGELSSVPASGGAPRPFSDLKTESPEMISHSRPQVLPGGKGVLFVAGTGVATGSLRVLPREGGPARTLVANSSNGRYAANGYLLFNRGVVLFAAPMDLERLQLTGPESPLIEGVAYDHFRGADFDVSASGTLIYRRSPPTANRAVMWLDSFGVRGRRVLDKAGAYTDPRLSPDGKRLALTSESELWIYDLGREKMTQLTFGSEVRCCTVWSPDGDYVVFRSKSGIAWTRWDGSGSLGRLPAGHGPSAETPWSFSSGWLAFFGNSPLTGYDLWAAPVDRKDGTLRFGQPQPLLIQPGLQAAPAISPDGKWLTYASDNETGRPEIYVIPFSLQGLPRAGKQRVSTDGGRAPRWSHNGDKIFFRSAHDDLMAVAVTTKGNSLQAEEPQFWSANRMADLGGPPNFDVASDGKRIVALFDVEATTPDETHLRVLLNFNDELRRQRANRPKAEPR